MMSDHVVPTDVVIIMWEGGRELRFFLDEVDKKIYQFIITYFFF